MGSSSNLPPSLRRIHQWPLADRIERQAAFETEVLAQCGEVASLLGVADVRAVEEEARWLLRNPATPDGITADQLEEARQRLYATAVERGLDPSPVATLEALLELLLEAGRNEGRNELVQTQKKSTGADLP